MVRVDNNKNCWMLILDIVEMGDSVRNYDTNDSNIDETSQVEKISGYFLSVFRLN